MEKRSKVVPEFLPIDFITFTYLFFTALLIIFSFRALENEWQHLLVRVGMAFSIIALAYLNQQFDFKWVNFFRNAYPLLFITYLYGETDYMNNLLFPNLDSYIFNIEQLVFSGQPSLVFSASFSWRWFSELMYFSYFSYYFLAFLVCFYAYRKKPEFFQKTVFLIILTFYFYYILFIILPVVGPQYFFAEKDVIVPEGYLFSEIVRFLQKYGENPTGAFPSSHVGLSIVFLIIAKKIDTKLFFIIFPVFVFLCMSTVYIKAHYLIDVVAGFISAPILYFCSNMVWKHLNYFASEPVNVPVVRYIFKNNEKRE
jgi:membrane-associated phospholipid phosphatase